MTARRPVVMVSGVPQELPSGDGAVIGVATATSLAVNGATIGSNAVAMSGPLLVVSGSGMTVRNGATDGFSWSQSTTNSWLFSGLSGSMSFCFQNTGVNIANGSLGVGVAANVAPTSTLQIVGSFGAPLVTKTATYTATATDFTILCDATSGAIVINLPTAVGIAGRIYNIKKIDSSANSVTIDGNSTETIDGATTKVTTTQYAGWQIQSNGANWFIL